MIIVKMRRVVAAVLFLGIAIGAQAQESSRRFYWPYTDTIQNNGNIFLEIRDLDSNVLEHLAVPSHPMVRVSENGQYALVADKSTRFGKHVVYPVSNGRKRTFNAPTYLKVSISDNGAVMYLIDLTSAGSDTKDTLSVDSTFAAATPLLLWWNEPAERTDQGREQHVETRLWARGYPLQIVRGEEQYRSANRSLQNLRTVIIGVHDRDIKGLWTKGLIGPLILDYEVMTRDKIADYLIDLLEKKQ